MNLSMRIIEVHASKLAKDFSDKKKKYIDVDEIAEKLGLQVSAHDLGSNVSGVLYIDKGKGVIGYNKSESEVRRRFTVAHEIGHFILHRLDNEIFVDKKEFKVLYRDNSSATGEIKQEREANAFAAALLMPRERVIQELQKMTFDLGDDKEDVINKLSETFKVSSQAMMFRISNLKLFIE
jgi:Zn-dependent peptidase ImmA (M78 family)